ncbi:MAG: TIGR03619 family F420-dependent LLM class oxidoreductase [Candidatus Thorarchaeota archaeon]
MKFGYEIENYGKYLDPGTLIRTTQQLENSNFHSIWALDHILKPIGSRAPDAIVAEVITTLAFLAGHTKSIKLGTGTLVLPIRNPILVAKQLATLDYLTKGRLIVSFGAGGSRREFEFLNQNFGNRGKRFNEALEVIAALWSGKTSFSGRYYNFQEAIFQPIRKELANLPILIAGNSDHALRRALKYGAGWFSSLRPSTTVKKRLTELREKLDGREFEVWLWLPIGPNENIDEVVAKCEKDQITGLALDLKWGPTLDREQVLQELCDYVKSY